MKLQSSYISLNDATFHAFHGVMSQERRVGALFIVTLRVGLPLSHAMESDDIADTIDYAALYQIVNREMAIHSQLLEHVGGRIVRAVEAAAPQATSIDLWITKKNPPMGADCDGAGIELHLINDKTTG